MNPVPDIVPYAADALKALDDVRAHFDSEYRTAEDAGDETAMTVYGRAGEHVHKLALLHAISESATLPTIRREAVEWGRDFAHAQAQRMLFKAQLHVADNPFHEICQRIKRRLLQAPGR